MKAKDKLLIASELKNSLETGIHDAEALYDIKPELESVFGPLKVRFTDLGHSKGYLKIACSSPLDVSLYESYIRKHMELFA